VTVVGAFDSFLRAGSVHAKRLERLGATVSYRIVLARTAQVSRAQLTAFGIPTDQVRTVTMEAVSSRAFLEREDVVFLALNGLRTRRFMIRMHRAFAEAPRRPVIVSLYPGLIFRFHLEGMASRMAADVLLLNSPKDLELYERALWDMGLDNRNAICAGLSFLPPRRAPLSSDEAAGRGVLFVGQPTVPPGRAERAYVLERFIGLAQQHPETQWWLKPRHRRHETTLHRVDHHYEDLLEEAARRTPVPPNLGVVHDPMRSVLDRTRLCLTMSSTAALEALRLGIPTRVLTDVGVHENIGNHFFLGSGLACTFDDVEPTMPHRLDEEWERQNIASAEDRWPVILERLEQALEERARSVRALPPPYPRLLGRSPAYDAFLEAREGWAALESFGSRAASTRERVRRITRPARLLLERGRSGWREAVGRLRSDGRSIS
jgi:hypothetical protein